MSGQVQLASDRLCQDRPVVTAAAQGDLAVSARPLGEQVTGAVDQQDRVRRLVAVGDPDKQRILLLRAVRYECQELLKECPAWLGAARRRCVLAGAASDGDNVQD